MSNAQTMDLFANGLDGSAEELYNNLPDIDVDWSGRWPRILAEMVDVTVAHLTRGGMAEEQARQYAQDWVIVIAQHFGGTPFYLPRGDSLKQAIRDSLIWQAFDGHNHRELARKHGITPKQIYVIIAQQRQLTRNRKQKTFDFG